MLDRLQMSNQIRPDALRNSAHIVEQIVKQTQFLCFQIINLN